MSGQVIQAALFQQLRGVELCDRRAWLTLPRGAPPCVPAAGLSEVITCMQHYVKVEYSEFGLAVLRERIRLQYAFNVAGTAGAARSAPRNCRVALTCGPRMHELLLHLV